MLRIRHQPRIAALACAALMPLVSHAQILKQRYPGRTECPDTHLRLTARHADGAPAAGLRAQDLYLWFSTGTADIRSMQSSDPGKPATSDTNLLMVVRPVAAVAPDTADSVMRNLHAAANLHWKVAMLAPDGSFAPFAAPVEEASLRSAVSKAATPLSIADWSAAERNAFRQLQLRPGRHVILELAQPAAEAPSGNADGEAFATDHTLDLLARDDMAQIYRLASDNKEQFEATGGRAAPTIDALFHAIVADAAGSYDLTIYPRFSCKPGASYSLRITSFRPDVQLFYPSEIRMATTPTH
jgi:hypothetical protein